MARINGLRIGGIDHNCGYLGGAVTGHSIVHRGPNAAAVCRLEETIAQRAGVDRQRRRWIDCEGTNIWSSWYAEVVLGPPSRAAVGALVHTIAGSDIHGRRRRWIEHDRK